MSSWRAAFRGQDQKAEETPGFSLQVPHVQMPALPASLPSRSWTGRIAPRVELGLSVAPTRPLGQGQG